MKECRRITAPNAQKFLSEFSLKSEQLRIPLSGAIEITRRCNLSCVHCYLGEAKNDPYYAKKEIGTKTWKRIIDEIVDAGCLFLLFTGGEPMLREDFSEIYCYARKSGLIVTVFSNGTRLTEDILDVFRDYPPHSIEISIYGASTETNQKITRRTGEFEKCLENMAVLTSNGFQVELKTILMTENRHELSLMQQMADDLGIKFRFDAAIIPCLDGNQKPLAYRISPEEAVETELSDDKNRMAWMEFADRMKGVTFSDALYDCGAGLNNFHIDPEGMLQPCLLISEMKYDLIYGNFNDGWNRFIPKISEKKIDAEFECRYCEKRAFCGFCPAVSLLETGSETGISEYLCAMGNHLYNSLLESQRSGGNFEIN
jgi:radical SAM protein with 4Fe4S-binding SPASM domain